MMSLNPHKTMDNIQDVIPESSPAAGDGAIAQSQETETVVVQPTPVSPGSKTPPENLLAALQEERRMRKEAENKLQTQTTTLSEDDMSDEGRMLKARLDEQEVEIARLQDERELDRLQNQFPALKDKSTEFDEFRKDYPRHKLENVAKIFMAENDLIDLPARKGLERPTSGNTTPPQSGMSVEEVKNLRINNYRKYLELIDKGVIRPQDMR